MHSMHATQIMQSASCITASLSPPVLAPRRVNARTLPVKRFSQSRRALVVTVRADLSEENDNKVSTEFLEELQNSGFDSSTPSDSSWQRDDDQQQQLARREEQLWQRQDALWQQQLAHWQHERQIWAQREAALLATIQDLHGLLTTASSRQIQTPTPLSPLQLEPATSSAQSQQPSLLQQDQPASTTAQSPLSATQPQSGSSQRISVPLDDSEPADPSVKAAEGEASRAGPDVKAPQGPPPPLSIGNDDIYWVHQLQAGLMDQGYYCGEEEMEDFVFGSGTESAVLSFQACQGVEESGVANDATWQALLKDKYQAHVPPVDEEPLEETPDLPRTAPPPTAPSTPKQGSQAKDPNPWQASWGDLFSSGETDTEPEPDSRPSSSNAMASNLPAAVQSEPQGLAGATGTAGIAGSAEASPAASAATTSTGQWKPYVNEEKDYSKWTVLREGDGGRHVHELQAALAHHGFWPGEDDMQWWQFGSDTCSAVQTFQATANLPESGVATSETWQALLGPKATPADAKALAMNDATDDDMTADHEGMVYLVGEQRWARRSGV